VPGADFVIGQADLLLGHLEAFLNSVVQGSVGWC
jgi:hypothetical protein